MYSDLRFDASLSLLALITLACALVAARKLQKLLREVDETKRERKRAEGSYAVVYAALRKKINELHRGHAQMDILARLSAALQLSESVAQAYPVLASFLQLLFPDSAGAVCILNPSNDLLEPVAEWGNNLHLGALPAKSCCGNAEGRRCVAGPGSQKLLCGNFQQEQTTSCLCVPLQAQTEILGSLHIVYPAENCAAETQDLFSESQHQLARAVADQIAITMANLRLRERLRGEAIRDPLTGLYNRRYMEESFEREVQRAERNRLTLALLMIDLDHFKGFNDCFGHLRGDQFLSLAAKLLLNYFRGHDIVCRYGGEEFAVVLPEASLELARIRATELCLAFRELHVLDGDLPLPAVTASIGVALFPTDGSTFPQLLASADRALYEAKRQGRNQVALALSLTGTQPQQSNRGLAVGPAFS